MATIDSKKKWNDTGIDLEAGRRYRYQARGRWTDSFIECDADGFSNAVMDLSNSAKRIPSARWFQLIGVVNQNPSHVIKLGTDGTFTASESGRLWAFANDAELFYFNNSGAVELHIHDMGLTTLPTVIFKIQDENTWDEKSAIVDKWGLPTRTLDAVDLNRSGTIITNPRNHPAFASRQTVLDKFHVGFDWQSDDSSTTAWSPQGLTGNADRANDEFFNERKWLLVSWHNENDHFEKGMRISLVDVTSWRNPIRYCNVLLVEPIRALSNHVSFRQINAHAGGVVWFRDYLYIVDARSWDSGAPGGLLVFDMTRIKEVDASRNDRIGWSASDSRYYAFGYHYVLPQVGRYVQVDYASADRLRWSFIGLDRTGTNRYLMMGEYAAERGGRLTWWKLDEGTGRLSVNPPGSKLYASLARRCEDEGYLQGCNSQNAVNGGKVWLSRTSANDTLYELGVNDGSGSTYEQWAQQPQGLTYSPFSDELWCVTEKDHARAVFAVKRADVP